jgi:DNA-binding NtrC family response regulator
MQSLSFVSRAAEKPAPHKLCCLIVEDQVLIALSIEAYMEDAGYDAIGPFTSGSAALEWLRNHTPQAAILDYNLKDGDCTDLAHELQERGVPFMIYSGHRHSPDIPPEFKDVPWLEKPCSREDILKALQSLVQPHS